MGATTIEWTDYTFNPWRGCSKVSPGCSNCYAETLSKRNPKTLGEWGPNGVRVVAAESYWRLPLKWDRDAAAAGERRRVFCASLADVFEDWRGPILNARGDPLFRNTLHDEPWDDGNNNRPGAFSSVTMNDVRARLFSLIDATPNLDWLLLTKRPEHITKMTPGIAPIGNLDPVASAPYEHHLRRYRPNVWYGTSIETAEYLHRADTLKAMTAAVHFLSIEPLLGPLPTLGEYLDGIDWVIVGGESGHGARPMHPDWARSIRDQCQAAGVPFFLKQWGEYVEWDGSQSPSPSYRSKDGQTPFVRVGKKAAGRLLDGREWNEFPEVKPCH